jgi:hypothetical protein
MKKFKWLAAVLVLGMLTVSLAIAGSATLLVTDNPTWTNGDPCTTITGHNIYYGTTKGGPYPNKFPVAIGSGFSINSLPTGTSYFRATMLATNLQGQVVESAMSADEAVRVIDDRVPSAPSCK